MNETWRAVPGYEGYYSVSSQGRVRREAPGQRTRPGRIIGAHVGRGGVRVRLHRDGKGRTIPLNRLVATVFLRAPGPHESVMPQDGDWSNCAVSNLVFRLSREVRRRPPSAKPKHRSPRAVAKQTRPPANATRVFRPDDAEPDYGAPFRSGLAAWLREKEGR
ncbi:MAG TPA: NUMOD4 domain-containing protein [Acidimicrobiales bacterium]|nr:NUMOD4 domain-containing protein [Acidimicrobiales bacterium]